MFGIKGLLFLFDVSYIVMVKVLKKNMLKFNLRKGI
jgi:hypothetical protein